MVRVAPEKRIFVAVTVVRPPDDEAAFGSLSLGRAVALLLAVFGCLSRVAKQMERVAGRHHRRGPLRRDARGWVPIELIVPVLVLGIGLCLLYHWTGSLYPGIALHAIGNSIPLAAELDWTWQPPR